MPASALELALISLGSAAIGGPVWSFLSSWLKIGVAAKKDEVVRLDAKVVQLTGELAACEEKHVVLEERLRAVEERTYSYFAMWIKDRNKRLVWLNDKAFVTLFAPLGYSREELPGKTFRDLLDPAAADEIDQLDRAALAHPGQTQSLLVQLHPSLPFLVVIKVASIASTGEVQYEGCAYSPGDPEIMNAAGARRQIVQRGASAEALFNYDQNVEDHKND